MHKRGILGGTFDPVHWGHLLLAETAVAQMKLEQAIWVPTRCPPHKQAASFEHRLEMVQTAIADNPAFAVSPESARSYAIDTLAELKSIYPDTYWYWIIGLDAFLSLPRWYCRQELVAECEWLVAPRLVSAHPMLNNPQELTAQIRPLCEQVAQQLLTEGNITRWQILSTPWVGFSSTLVRQYCRARQSIRYLVPEAVRSYITTNNLYSH